MIFSFQKDLKIKFFFDFRKVMDKETFDNKDRSRLKDLLMRDRARIIKRILSEGYRLSPFQSHDIRQ